MLDLASAYWRARPWRRCALTVNKYADLIELCGYPHNVTYADLAVMPIFMRAGARSPAGQEALPAGVVDLVGIIARLP